jgi:ribonuclease HII
MIVKGDAVSVSIAAASIVAKVTRDRIMTAVSPYHPSYHFESNKGYPCPRHMAALAAWGPSSIHRLRWAFMDDLRWTGVPRRQIDDGAQESLF